ncbi:MAG: dihydroxy-acid dehydratase [Anaerolineae bacterium]|nr:dihydroxy-acid dehydratase [Anaerolineae bacterium]
MPNRSMILHVTDEEITRRREGWTPLPPKIRTGYLSRYTRMVASASEGAILK